MNSQPQQNINPTCEMCAHHTIKNATRSGERVLAGWCIVANKAMPPIYAACTLYKPIQQPETPEVKNAQHNPPKHAD
jgi:hypothetical protein